MQSRHYVLSHENQFKEAIAILEFHSKQNINLATSAYAKVTRIAVYAAAIIFTAMAYFLHATLLGSYADITSHIFAFILNSVIALVTFSAIREFHPLHAIGAQYLKASDNYKKQIKVLMQEMKAHGNDSHQQRDKSVTSALMTADNLIHQ